MSRISCSSSSGAMCLHMPRPASAFLLFLAILFSFAVPPLRADWQRLPAGEPSVEWLVADSSGQRLLCYLAGAGIWLSENAGENWLPISDRFAADAISASAPYVYDSGADTVIASFRGRQQQRLNSYSTDWNNSWQLLPPGNFDQSNIYQVWRNNSAVWFRYAPDRSYVWLYRSWDFGQTWADSSSIAFANVIKLLQDSAHDSTLFVLAQDDNPIISRVYRSDDLGHSWVTILRCDTIDALLTRDFLRLSNGDLLLCYGYNATSIAKSSDDGQSWDTYAIEAGPEWPIEVIENTGDFGQVFLSGSRPGGVWRSLDYGLTWEQCTNGLPQNEEFGAQLYQNRHGGAVYAVFPEAVYKSVDSGEIWQPVSLPSVGFGENMSFTILENSIFVRDTYVKSMAISPPTMAWQLEMPDMTWYPVDAFSSRQDTLTIPSPILHKSGDTLLCMLMEWSEYGENRRSRKAVSVDNGISWRLGDVIPFTLQPLLACRFVDADTERWIIGKESGWVMDVYADSLIASTDLGQTWSVLTSLLPRKFLSVVASEGMLYALTSGPSSNEFTYGREVYRSFDLGQSWESLALPPSSDYQNLLAVNDELFVLDYTNQRCFNWRNGSWYVGGPWPFTQTQPTWLMEPYFSFFVTAVPGDPPTLVAAQIDSNAVWISTDRGLTWGVRDYHLPFEHQNPGLSSLTYDPYRNRIWVSAGIGVCYLDASELSTDGPLVFKPVDYTLLSVYPNPFNGEAKIRFDLLKREAVSVTVYDVLGREVRTVVDEIRDAGRHEVSLSLPDAASGLYFIRLQAVEKQRTQKVMLLR